MNVEIVVASRHRQRDGFLLVDVRVPEISVQRQLDISFEELRRFCGWRDELSLDFLLIASLCYVIDKTIDRDLMPDRWTRELEVSVPVSDPERWQSVSMELGSALSFLTGDIWKLSFYKLEKPHWRPLRTPRRGFPIYGFKADAVCLFSGGLDSLVGAVDFLASSTDGKVLLVGHHDGAAAEQTTLYNALRRRYPGRTRLLRVRIGHRPQQAEETTLRSRSLVFLALGMYAARSYGPDVPMYACENGVIALNVPLTPSRAGSCSTRTMHPFFLNTLVTAVTKAGFSNPLLNTLEFKTKGECITDCGNAALLQSVVNETVSCSHATRRQHWVRRDAGNCGYCVPCLFRRASLHRAGWDDGNRYGLDVCRGELSVRDEGESADDLRAMLDFLRSNLGEAELASEISRIASVSRLDERVAMVGRGFEEVRALFRDKGNDVVLRAAAVSSTESGADD